MKKVLVTGASGTVGKEIIKQLIKIPDIQITAFDIKSKNAVNFFSGICENINLIYGDISIRNEIEKACKDIDVVIHLAAVIPPLADKLPQLAKAVNVTGTGNLIKCLEELSPNAFIIYASSISVYGDRNKNPFIKVTDHLIASTRDEYALTKIEAEQLVTNSKLNWTIFRLTAIMGTDNHKASGIMFHMPLDNKLEIATPKDTARAFVNAINHQPALNKKIYNLSGGEKCRIEYKAFLSRSFQIFGLGQPDFPPNAFAEKNFHCGYYADGDILEDILHFRNDTIGDYFDDLKKSVPPLQKAITSIFKKAIKYGLQKQSEPLAAIKNNHIEDLAHYFHNK